MATDNLSTDFAFNNTPIEDDGINNIPDGNVQKTQSVTEQVISGYTDTVDIGDIPSLNGTNSLFNNYVVFRVARSGVNKMDYDNKDHYLTNFQDQYAKGAATPTAAQIIEWSSNQSDENSVFGPAPYAWNDFLYCKYYGKIPNNYLLTLRRYPLPIMDNLKGPDSQIAVPIAQCVTWLGDEPNNKLKDIMKWSYGYIWKSLEAGVQEVDGNETQLGSGVEQFAPDKIQKALGLATVLSGGNNDWDGRKAAYNQWAAHGGGSANSTDGPYFNKVYGPVNVVNKTFMRDRGLNFSNEITLNFQYKLNSYDRISPKVAMLDVISNFLLLTYSNAKFWGGATRYFPKANKVGFLGDQSKFYSGDYDGYFGSVTTQLSGFAKGAMDFLGKLASNPGEILKSLGDIGAKLGLGNLSSKSRPSMLSIRSLLTGEPIGEWHLTVGNPLNPIAVIGNLILKDTTIEFSDKLGAEDFPTEVYFTVKLDHGKPRDKGDIESMLNLGAGRMYYSTLGQLPSEQNTFGNPVVAKQQQTDKNNNATAQGTLNQYKSDIDVIRNRVAARWGNNFANGSKLDMFVKMSKTNF